MPSQINHFHHDQIADQGFTLIKDFLSPQEVEYYRDTARKVVEIARKGEWDDVRTRGKQFPPWPKNFSPDIWGVSGLLHPKLQELSSPFQQCYSDDRLLAVVCDILQTDVSDITMELFNMLINPLTDFGLQWNRDYIKPDTTAEEEAEQLLQHPYAGTQFNMALTNDECLIVVPGSHKRVRTDEEREITTSEDAKQVIPGQITVKLNPGDVVFYNSNILHRAQYFSSQERLTLHGSYGHKNFGHFRAKGVLQHGVGHWVNDFHPTNSNMKSLHVNLVELASQFQSHDLGYSLNG